MRRFQSPNKEIEIINLDLVPEFGIRKYVVFIKNSGANIWKIARHFVTLWLTIKKLTKYYSL